ncbi:MAG: hypothetical protein ACR2FF_03440 [Mycobacteriales bacterium]|nr:MAG: carbohydrate-binding protein [Pseudonocardiales bacterium]
MRTHRRAVAAVALAATVIGITAAVSPAASGGVTPPQPYSCGVNGSGTISGTFGDAGLIGWQGDKDGVVACLGGSFYVRDGKDATYGYGVYDNAPTTWGLSGGYLPAAVTGFHRAGAAVTITNFGDDVTVGAHAYVVIYSRVRVSNPTGSAITLDPAATSGLVSLRSAPSRVPAHATVDHDYAVAADRFGQKYAWPAGGALRAAGGFDQHFGHMRSFWNAQLAHIAGIGTLPDRQLVNAYKSGYIYTQIIRDGNRLNTGENGYDEEFSHDVIGILANLFTQGDFTNAHALLLRARYVIGSQRQYDDGVWKYSWPWALYLLKTNDLAFVKANFATRGTQGAMTPSIKEAAHQIAADRTGPGGIMKLTNDIDAGGYWTIDDYSALFGLAAYKYLAQRVGAKSEVSWASGQYNSLLAATNKALRKTISTYHLNYLPCSMIEPNDDNRCSNPEDANWAAPFLFGRWAWDGYLFGARQTGPGINLIDATYRYGFGRLAGKLPANTFGGYSPDFYSTGYNAGYGSWGLASATFRSQGVASYEFMVDESQSGPFSWWESSDFPNTGSPWQGVHPAQGNGSAPHAWGIANANKVLLDSILAQRSDGTLLVGRGVPAAWLRTSTPIAVSNFPTVAGRRSGIAIRTVGRRVTLRISGDRPGGAILFELPSFVRNIVSASAGHVDNSAGQVRLPPSVRQVTVVLRSAP